MAVDEPQHLVIVLHGTDEPFAGRDLPAQERKNLSLHSPAISISYSRILLPAESLISPVVRLDVTRGAIDDLQSRFVTRLVVIIPRTHPMMAQEDAASARMILDQLLNFQPNIETGPLPGDVDNIVAINFFGQFLLIN